MSLQSNFHKAFPNAFFLDGANPDALEKYLIEKGRLDPDEKIIAVGKPGEGNMNYVLRIKTNRRTFIVKQARPWVEKYPQIPAPVERSSVEALYLKNTGDLAEISGFSPKFLWHEVKDFILAQEDLGEVSDFSFLYKGDAKITDEDLARSLEYLRIVHYLPLSTFPANLAMRKLNHEHIFHFPFQEDNGLDLNSIQPGLADVAKPFQKNDRLKNLISRLGEIYLSQGRSLIHGDFYPGSWLKTGKGIMIIDPEFAFHGAPEFDLGVMMAHMLMSKHDFSTLQKIWDGYNAPANFDHGLLSAFTGVEIMRRTIGIAQLPLNLTIAEKINLMSNALEWIEKENLLFKIIT